MVKIILFVLLLIILLLITLKIKVEILELTSINLNNTKFKFKIKFYTFGFLKLFEIILTEKGMKIFKSESEYKYTFSDLFKKLLEKENVHIIDMFSLKNLSDLNIKIKSLNLKLKIGALENMVTSILITIISTLLSSLFLVKNKLYSKNKFYYEIYPEFDKFCLNVDLNLKLEVYFIGVYKFITNNYMYVKDLIRIIKTLKQNDELIKDVTMKKLKESSI